MMINIKQLLLLFLSIFLLISCARTSGNFQPIEEGETNTQIETEVETTVTPIPTRAVQRGTTILVEGQLMATNPELSLSFVASGKVITLHVQAGDVVDEGDLIATLDDEVLQEAVRDTELQVAQAENSLAQAQLSLDNLLNWQADNMAVAVAEANLAVAQANYEAAVEQDASAGNNLTSARISITQAQRHLEDVQEAYDTAFDPARDWELGVPGRKEALEAERDGITRARQEAQENLSIAYANYNLALSSLNDNTALSAEASVVGAQQAVEQATTGPKPEDIAAARLTVAQSELSLQQAQISLGKAQDALLDTELYAPWAGTIMSVDTTVGALVSASTPIVLLKDTHTLQFHTSNLSERDLAQVAAEQSVEITFKSYPQDPIAGSVARIVPQASGVVGDAATFTVVVDLEESELVLYAGMTGRAEIQQEAE